MEIQNLDIRDFKEEVVFHKDIATNNVSNGYQILFWKILPYKVPIAFQSALALTKDLRGDTINDIYNMSQNIRMQFMHLVVLPLEEQSVVLAFYHKRDKLYKNLWHQFNTSSEAKIMQFLNYIIFAYAENYFISKTIKNEIETNEQLSLLAQEKDGNPNLGLIDIYNNFSVNYQPVTMEEIPNFLSEKWKIS